MDVRLAREEDIPLIMELFDNGRRIMASCGNMSQWRNGYPSEDVVRNDIRLQRSYLILDDVSVLATFVLLLTPEPTYAVIYGGEWGSDASYGTIHRLAKSSTAPSGIFEICLEYCLGKIGYIRIDTHEDNIIMRRVLERNGFRRCGTIFLADGSPRLAYEK